MLCIDFNDVAFWPACFNHSPPTHSARLTKIVTGFWIIAQLQQNWIIYLLELLNLLGHMGLGYRE